ncbi:MAG: DEAD/DEAH box helicase [Owenweeksia sp.]|nr:DEAD/DEAH box helicase [Owenweeksia sp.]
MPAEIKRMVKNYMHDPKEVRINTGQRVNINIEHQYAVIKASDKVEALRRILDFDADLYGVVFCRTKRDTQRVAEELVENRATRHEPISPPPVAKASAMSVTKRFRAGNLQLLIATDVAARGIDVDNLTHVIHFCLARWAAYDVHRSGRTARAGKKGISLSLIH